MKLYIRSYRYSDGAKSIAQGLGGKVIKLRNSRYRHRSDHFVINWGCTTDNPSIPVDVNKPCAVAVASNKLLCMRALKEANVRTVPWTDDPDVARSRWYDNGSIVFCRTLLNASGGRGIIVSGQWHSDLVPSRLYTKYVKKLSEWRVHVIGDNTVVQKKLRSYNEESPDWFVRNHRNGFIYSHVSEDVPQEAVLLAKRAVSSIGLDFGAVDILYNEHRDKYYVLEVNTAPGLVGSTLDLYTTYLRGII